MPPNVSLMIRDHCNVNREPAGAATLAPCTPPTSMKTPKAKEAAWVLSALAQERNSACAPGSHVSEFCGFLSRALRLTLNFAITAR